jgi:CheY-like chemotaxis protein
MVTQVEGHVAPSGLPGGVARARSRAVRPASRVDSASGRVLVVDPDPDARRILIMLLEHRGYFVAATDDPLTALELARARVPHAILGEHPQRLPDGSLLCETLLLDEATRGIPFLAVTAGATPAELVRARRTHPAGVAVKPLPLLEIAELVDGLVGARRSRW